MVTGNNEHEISDLLTHELSYAATWLRIPRLTLNTKNPKAMLFGPQPKLSVPVQNDIVLQFYKINFVKELKYLSIILDHELSFVDHVNYLIYKVIPKVKTMTRIRILINKNLAIYLYSSLIAPVFSFNDHIIILPPGCRREKTASDLKQIPTDLP